MLKSAEEAPLFTPLLEPLLAAAGVPRAWSTSSTAGVKPLRWRRTLGSTSEEPDIGPLINQRQLDRVMGFIAVGGCRHAFRRRGGRSLPRHSDFGLAAAVWTTNLPRGHRLAKSIKAGTVWLNCQMVLDASMPFGGFQQSGWGRERSLDGIEAYLQTKSVFADLPA